MQFLFHNLPFPQKIYEILDVAKFYHGSKSLSNKLIDNDLYTSEPITTFNVKFPTYAKLSKIELYFIPANGVVNFFSVKNGKETLIHKAHITTDTKSISFTPNANEEFIEIKVDWTLNSSKLEVKEFIALTYDENTIFIFKSISEAMRDAKKNKQSDTLPVPLPYERSHSN